MLSSLNTIMDLDELLVTLLLRSMMLSLEHALATFESSYGSTILILDSVKPAQLSPEEQPLEYDNMVAGSRFFLDHIHHFEIGHLWVH